MLPKGFRRYPFKKPGEISEVCVEQENALDSNFGNFLPQNIEMILPQFGEKLKTE
jgi:hypothetical protein